MLLSTLVCCQPTELILGFFCFINFLILLPLSQVTHIINAAASTSECYHSDYFEYLQLHFNDSHMEPLTSYLPATLSFIDQARREVGRVSDLGFVAEISSKSNGIFLNVAT